MSPCVGGRLNLAWAISAVKQICELLAEKSCLAFFKISKFTLLLVTRRSALLHKWPMPISVCPYAGTQASRCIFMNICKGLIVVNQ